MTDTISPAGQPSRENEINRAAAGSSRESTIEATPEAHLLDLQSMAVMGELSEAVAHDFNNVVSAALIHLGLFLQDPQLNAAQKESMKSLEQEMTRAAGLTRQLLSFSRRRFASNLETVDLNKLVGGIEKLLNHLVRENVSLSFQPSAEECWIRADVGQIEKLVMCLCLVGRDALCQGGRLLLKTSLVRYDGVPRTIEANLAGELVCLAVSGTANEERLQRIGHGPARAVGETAWDWKLDAARQIAEKHGGWIKASAGAPIPEFQFYLPVANDSDQALENAAATEEIKGGTETILLIEDEHFLRRVSAQSLRKLGYAVLEAADSEAALKQWEKHQAKIDLVLTDLLLPGSESGFDLALLFASQKPSLRVMLSSGDHADLDQCSRKAAQPFFPALKPYTASRLALWIRQCLDSKA